MKNRKTWRVFVVAGIIFCAVMGLIDCSVGAETEAKVIRIGIGNAYNPFCYLNEKEELTGYEYEVLKKVDERLPQYEFQYEPTEFANILVGIDTGSYSMGVHGFGWNAERAGRYLYSEVPSVTTGGYVMLAAEGKDFKDLSGLASRKVQVKTGSNVANLLEAYNKENPDKAVEIVYEDSENEQIVSNLVNGVYDAYINEKIDADQWVKQFGGIREYGEKLFDNKADSGCYYLYNKGEGQLEKDVSEVLQKLHDEGLTGKISVEYLGEDYTK
jgi:ABC-type amino acid transport substrate-binding protein